MAYSIIIGGSMKCGTTTFFSLLSSYSKISPALIKQTHYFTKDHDLKKMGVAAKRNLSYKSFFKKNSEITLEATPEYMYSKYSLLKIREHFKINEGKFIVILRNPIDRFISYYNYLKQQGKISKKMKINNFLERCKNCDDPLNKKYGILESGKFSRYIIETINILGKENVQIFYFEELINNNYLILEKIEKKIKNLGIFKKKIINKNETKEIRFRFLSNLYRMIRRFLIANGSINMIIFLRKFISPIYKMFNQKNKSKNIITPSFYKEISILYDKELKIYLSKGYYK